MITSWNGVYLTDFASFKPTCLPVDNPADFVYFFDASSRRTCYLAPERFQEDGALDLTNSMDIFSAGCVIAELFLEGHPIFNLSQLLKYRKMEFDPAEEIEGIEDEQIKVILKFNAFLNIVKDLGLILCFAAIGSGND
jgi:phosphoinositide-3-kinase regulatory subunit 4